MTAMTDYLEDEIADHVLGTTSYSKPSATYLSLHTASPTDAGLLTAEISTGGGSEYAREELTSNIVASSGGVVTNDTAISFEPAGSNWGTITHVGICDASSSGNMLLWAALDVSKAIDIDDSFQVAIGQLSITFQ
jgi:hypothetical protein